MNNVFLNSVDNRIAWIEKVRFVINISGRSDLTFNVYRRHITKFFNYFSSDTDFFFIREEEILDYLKICYFDLGRASSTINVAIFSIRYLYSVCFKIDLNKKLLPSFKITQSIPIIFPKSDFIKIFNLLDNLKYKCWFLLGFCSGLRGSEVVSIRIENIFADEHKIKILGKGNKERFTILPDITIKFLRLYCKYNHITQKTGFLFPGNDPIGCNSRKFPDFVFRNIKRKYNLPQNVSFHSLRHSFATYYLINGGDMLTLQSMLGHTNFNTTKRYIHVSRDFNHLEGIRYVD